MQFIGVAAVMLASLGIGIQSIRQRRRRLRCLRGLSDALAYLVGELSGKRSPLTDLILSVCQHTSGDVRSFFMCLSESLSKLGKKSFSDLWRTAADRYLLLTDEERSEWIGLGEQLGRTELTRQIAMLDRCREFILLSFDKERSALQNDRRILLGIPAAAGALLSILLL